MIELSIDGATKKTGWSVFEDGDLIDYGCILQNEDSLSGRNHRHERIVSMVLSLEEIVKRYNVEHIICEAPPPSTKNSDTVLALGNLQGAIIFMAIKNNVQIDFIEVATWHSALKILKKNGDLKKQSIDLANKLYELDLVYKSPSSKFNQDDIADSICIYYYMKNFDNNKTYFGNKNKTMR